MSKQRIWRFLCFLILAVVYFYTLLNVAYFNFFGHFLDTSHVNDFTYNAQYLHFIAQYAVLVPRALYFIAATILMLLGFLWRTLSTIQNASQKKGRWRLAQFVGLQLFLFSVSAYFLLVPQPSWWSTERKAAELGVIGHGYEEIIRSLTTEKHNLFQSDIAQGKEQVLARSEQLAQLMDSNPYRTAHTQQFDAPVFEEPPNILIFNMESVPSWPLKNAHSPMPYLQHLIDTNISVKEFFPNSCQTINAEFTSLCSLWAHSSGPISEVKTNSPYHCLPHILKHEYGYNTYYSHANFSDFWSRETFMPAIGFDVTQFAPPFEVRQYDGTVLTESIDRMAASKKPFFGFVMGYTSHTPHNEEVMQANWEISQVVITPFEATLDAQLVADSNLSEKQIRDYFGFLQSVDAGIEMTFDHLRKKDLLKNTIVIVMNDHRSYGFSSHDERKNFHLYNESPFVMVLPEQIKAQIQPIASHIDIAPTLLDVLGETRYKEKYNFFGQSVFAKDFVPEVFNTCLGSVYYKNEHIVLQGNPNTDLYTVLESDYDEDEQTYYKTYVRDLTAQSDAVILGR